MTASLQLPPRAGDRPETTPTNPHQQLNQNAPALLQEELYERGLQLPGVRPGPTGVPELDGSGAVIGTRAFILDEQMAKGPREAFLIDTEFAHIHPTYDGSLHLCVPADLQAHVLEQGWGETHMLAGKTVGGLDVSARNTMIFGPRDAEEAEIVWHLVHASYEFACG